MEGVGEVFDLVLGPVQRDTFVQATVGDPSGRRGDLLQRMQCSSRQEPSESPRHDPNDTECDERGDEHGVEDVIRVLLELRAQFLLCLMGALKRARLASSRFAQSAR